MRYKNQHTEEERQFLCCHTFVRGIHYIKGFADIVAQTLQQSHEVHIIILPPGSLPSDRRTNFLEYTVLLIRLGNLGVRWRKAQGFGPPSY